MPEITKKLTPTEVTYGLLMLAEVPRDSLPLPTHKITIIDSDGEKFEAKMHSSALRVDGLTQLHRKHRTYKGQSVTLEVDPSKQGVVNVRFGGEFEDKAIPDKSVQELKDSAPVSNEITDSFDTILDEVESSIIVLNRQGAQAIGKGKYEIARDLIEKGKRLTVYRDKVKELRDEWPNILSYE